MPDYASQIDEFLRKKGSPMAGLGGAFVGAGKKYGVDPRLVVAISGIESSFGKHLYGAHNAWGWGPGKPFSSWEHGISEVTRGLRQGYLNRGLKTPAQIVNRYAPASDGNDTGRWVNTVNQFMGEMGATVPVHKHPTWKTPSAVPTSAEAPQAGPSLDLLQNFDPMQNLRQTAIDNLNQIASGRFLKPTEQLASLSRAAVLDKQASDLVRALTPAPTPDLSPSTPPGSALGAVDMGGVTSSGRLSFKPGGGWGGSYNLAKGFAGIAKDLGLGVMSEKRERQHTASGGISDHWVGNKNAYAFDLSNGSSPTREMDAAARAIMARLGVRYDGKSELVRNVNVGDYRVQVLYRTHVGGNHFNHIHVGVRRR